VVGTKRNLTTPCLGTLGHARVHFHTVGLTPASNVTGIPYNLGTSFCSFNKGIEGTLVLKRTRVPMRQRRGDHQEGLKHLDVLAGGPSVRLDVVGFWQVADALEDALQAVHAAARTAVLADVAREAVRQTVNREGRRGAGLEDRALRTDGERWAEAEGAGRHCWKWL
tara:strand:- start:347 stop:847 length:501 start_codon:yes stop_codon:yes gene_type:complete